MSKIQGGFLRKIRVSKKLTQTQVANHLGISRQAYAYYERTSSMPDTSFLLQLSELYHLPLSYFLEENPEKNESLVKENQPYHTNSYENDIYPEFLDFYSKHENMKKYHHLNTPEKKLLFLFQKLHEKDQEELMNMAYFKSFFPHKH